MGKAYVVQKKKIFYILSFNLPFIWPQPLTFAKVRSMKKKKR